MPDDFGMETTTTQPEHMTLSEIFTETCQLCRTIADAHRKGITLDGKPSQRLALLRQERERRTCLPMLA